MCLHTLIRYAACHSEPGDICIFLIKSFKNSFRHSHALVTIPCVTGITKQCNFMIFLLSHLCKLHNCTYHTSQAWQPYQGSARIRRVRIAVCDAFLPSCESFYEGMDCIIIHLLLMPKTRNKPV